MKLFSSVVALSLGAHCVSAALEDHCFQPPQTVKDSRGKEFKFDISTLMRTGAQTDYKGESSSSIHDRFFLNVCAPVRTKIPECQGSILCENSTNPSTRATTWTRVVVAEDKGPQWKLIHSYNASYGIEAVYSETIQGHREHIYLQYHCSTGATETVFHKSSTSVTVVISSELACPLNDTDIKDLPEGKITDTLAKGAWTYYKFHVENEAGHLLLQMKALQGDPDIYVQKSLKPTKNMYEYRGSSSFEYERLSIYSDADRSPLTQGDYIIGIFGFGDKPAEYTLEASLYQCPVDCNKQGGCDSTTHTCECFPGFVSPPESHGDCGAHETTLELKKQVTDQELTTKSTWNYYRVTVPENAYELKAALEFVDVKANHSFEGSIGLYIRKEDYPTKQTHDAYDISWSYSSKSQLTLKLKQEQISAGDWLIGVQHKASSDTPVRYNLVVSDYNCPDGCSGHGECNDETHVCTCEADYNAVPKDCSVADKPLKSGDNLPVTLTSYQTTYYHMAVPEVIANGEVELVVHTRRMSAEKEADHYPMLYMKKDAAPMTNNYDFVSAGHNSTIITLSPSELTAGIWYIGLYNPRSSNLTFTFETKYSGRCLNQCGGHGSCDVSAGAVCRCEKDWLGGDCSVQLPPVDGGVGGGTVFFLILLFGGIGVGGGIYLKKIKPHLCEKENAADETNEENYHIEDHMNMTLGADYISMQGDEMR